MRAWPSTLVLCCSLTAAACSSGGGGGSAPHHEVALETMRAAAEAATGDMAQFLSDTLTYASVEKEGPTLLPETEALLDYVLGVGRTMGFSARRAAGGLVGILEYGRGQETVGVLIHLDVVPSGALAEWQRPPFSGAIADGKVFGRGAQDDKGALVGVLWGAKILIDDRMTFDRRLRIILGTKEETTFEDVDAYFREEAAPDFGIVPDGPFIIRGESGYADLVYTFSGFATTPDRERRDRAVYWDGGTAINSVPDLSYVVFRSSDREAARAEIESLIAQVTAEFTRGNKVPDLSVVDYETFVDEQNLDGVPPGDLVLVSHGQSAHSSIPARAATRSSKWRWSARGWGRSPRMRLGMPSRSSTSASASPPTAQDSGSTPGARHSHFPPPQASISSVRTSPPSSSSSPSTSASAAPTRRRRSRTNRAPWQPTTARRPARSAAPSTPTTTAMTIRSCAS